MTDLVAHVPARLTPSLSLDRFKSASATYDRIVYLRATAQYAAGEVVWQKDGQALPPDEAALFEQEFQAAQGDEAPAPVPDQAHWYDWGGGGQETRTSRHDHWDATPDDLVVLLDGDPFQEQGDVVSLVTGPVGWIECLARNAQGRYYVEGDRVATRLVRGTVTVNRKAP